MFPSMRRSSLATTLILAGWLGSSSVSMAQVPPDVMLTYQARNLLDQDESLANFNIGVQIRDGSARLFGSLPSADLIKKAEARLREMKGLRIVTNDLQIVKPTEAQVLRMPVDPPRQEPRRMESVSLMAPVPAPENSERTSSPSSVASLAPLTSDRSSQLTNQSEIPPSSTPARSRSDVMLAAAIEELRWTDHRFVRVQVEVLKGTVFLRGQVSRGEDGMELARKVAGIYGVEGVVLNIKEVPVLPGRSH